MATSAQIAARIAELDAARNSFNEAAGIWNAMASGINAALPALRSDGGASPDVLVAAFNAIVAKAVDAAPQLAPLIAAAQGMTPSDGGASPPTIADARATPTTVSLGQTSVISATVTGATAISVNGVAVTLPYTVTPALGTTAYTIVATGPGGTASATVGVTATSIVVPPPPTGDARPVWALNAPLNTWIDVPGTRPLDLPIPSNPSATALGLVYGEAYRGGMLAAWSGFSFQRHASPRLGGPHSIIHLGPSGGHNADGMANYIQRIVLGAETPYMDWEYNGTPGRLWYDYVAYWGYDPADDPGPGSNTGFGQAHGGHSMYGNVFSEKKGWVVSTSPWTSPPANQVAPAGYPYYVGPADHSTTGPYTQYDGKFICVYDVENHHWIAPELLPKKAWGGSTSMPVCVDYEKDEIYVGILMQPFWWKFDADAMQFVNSADGQPTGFVPAVFDNKYQRIIQPGAEPTDVLKPMAIYVGGARTVLTIIGDGADMVIGAASSNGVCRNSFIQPAEAALGCAFVHAVYDVDGFVTLYRWSEVNETTYSVDKWDVSNRPPNGHLNGMYNKFHHAPELGGYIMLNNIGESVKFLRVV